MKKSENLLGLSVISIEDGKEIGGVGDLVINPAKGKVDYLIVNCGSRYLGFKVLPFKLIEGIGEFAVTVLSSSSVTEFADQPEISELLEKNIRVKGTKVLTKKGMLIGTVSEFFIDDNNEGKITGCEVTPVSKSEQTGIIPAGDIVTFGKDVLIVNEGFTTVPAESLADLSRQPVDRSPKQPASPVKDKIPEVKEQEPSEAAKLFEEKQWQYLLGRKVSKRIENESGELITEEGDIITEELLNKAKAAGKFTELSMNTKA